MYILQRHKQVSCYSHQTMILTARKNLKTHITLLRGIQCVMRLRNDIEKNDPANRRDIAALNAMIIINIAAAIEGAITTLLIQHITRGENYKEANRNENFELRRIFDNLIDQIQISQWKNLNKNSEIILNFDFKSIYAKNWESITFLFDFRNLLAHGGTITEGIDVLREFIEPLDSNSPVKFKDHKKTEIHNRKNLFSYLHKYNYIDMKDKNYLFNGSILSTIIANHFLHNGLKFLMAVYKEYSKKYREYSDLKLDLEILKEISSS